MKVAKQIYEETIKRLTLELESTKSLRYTAENKWQALQLKVDASELKIKDLLNEINGLRAELGVLFKSLALTHDLLSVMPTITKITVETDLRGT